MGKKYKILLGVILGFAVIAVVGLFLSTVNVEVLNPKGEIAARQRDLMVFATVLSLLVLVPVYVLAISFAYKYRESNKKAKYTPDWGHNRTYETIWWGLPVLLILILSIVTWNTTHSLDPFKPLASDAKPLEVQVVALQWKWLFIYPEQNVATVNYLQIPVNRPINLTITSDAPMNSLWIPQLGGQIYAMSGMSTKLHLIADTPGTYNGSSANISGAGFAGMKFAVAAVSPEDFDMWALNAQQSQQFLSFARYDELAKPSENNQAETFAPVQDGLYDTIVMKYMLHTNVHEHEHTHDEGAE